VERQERPLRQACGAVTNSPSVEALVITPAFAIWNGGLLFNDAFDAGGDHDSAAYERRPISASVEEALVRFCDLEAEDEILRFGSDFGALHLCELHGEPCGHDTACAPRTVIFDKMICRFESLEGWRLQIARARAHRTLRHNLNDATADSQACAADLWLAAGALAVPRQMPEVLSLARIRPERLSVTREQARPHLNAARVAMASGHLRSDLPEDCLVDGLEGWFYDVLRGRVFPPISPSNPTKPNAAQARLWLIEQRRVLRILDEERSAVARSSSADSPLQVLLAQQLSVARRDSAQRQCIGRYKAKKGKLGRQCSKFLSAADRKCCSDCLANGNAQRGYRHNNHFEHRDRKNDERAARRRR
jgi:hypothetical protein